MTISGDTYLLDAPFLVLATQNPIETEGTYRLPEAQVDRFMFKLLIDYPSKAEEKIIIRRMTRGEHIDVRKMISEDRIREIQLFNQEIYADETIEDYVTDIVDATRNPSDYNLDVGDMIEYGASPRASIYLILSGKAHAMLDGRGYVVPGDVKAIAADVLRHRIFLSYEAEAEEVTAGQIIGEILKQVKSP